MEHLTALSLRAGWISTITTILLAWVLTQAIGWVYARTHSGLSYSRSMTHALVVAGIVAAMLMMAIGNSLARGIGIVGTLALIRFRINLRDPMDMLFVFAAFGAGIAAGTGSHFAGVIGTTVFLFATWMLRRFDFGALQAHDGVLRLQIPADGDADVAVGRVLKRHCRTFALITLREAQQGEVHERLYQITLRKKHSEGRMLQALTAIPGAAGVSISLQEATLEV